MYRHEHEHLTNYDDKKVKIESKDKSNFGKARR